MITKWKSCIHVTHEPNMIAHIIINHLLGLMELWCIFLAFIAVIISALSV